MAEPQSTTPPPLSNLKTTLIVTSVSGVTLLGSFLSGALTIALPSVAEDLGISAANLQWPVSMYSLVNGVFLLVAGGLADTLGRKTLFLVGTAAFAIIALGVSFAQTSFSFIILMSLLGLGPAILSPAGAGILGATFPPGSRIRTIAFASLGAGQPIGFITGLVAGGILSSKWCVWRSLYWLLCGLSTGLGVTAIYSLPPDVHLTRSRMISQLKEFDWIGALLSSIGATSLIFALSDAESAPDGWSTPYIPALLPTAATFLVSFLWWEEKREQNQKHVLMPLSIWRAKGLGTMIAMIFCAWAAFNSMQYLATLMYQQVQRISPLRTAIYFLPMAGSGTCVPSAAKFPTRLICSLRQMDPNANYGFGMLWVMLLSVGPDLFFSAANLHIQNSVGEDKQALAGSLFMIATRYATALGLAVCSAVSTAEARRYTQKKPSNSFDTFNSTSIASSSSDESSFSPDALLQGLRAAGWACLAFTILAFIIAVFGLRGTDIVEKRTSDDEPTRYNEEIELPELRTPTVQAEGNLRAEKSGFEGGDAEFSRDSTVYGSTFRSRMNPTDTNSISSDAAVAPL
ncbi:hypothetical protein M407DRAFT_218794 [Tulasnella calospora MUT 4182]|uniref:Major facilitator superfamily (MFS) profile domain-containing protein n=1 Tax=Tulasnella calospora MUT 4182 TaxID=1051891 RepID=A0A0C3QTN3_9AGAM|nr:hypothetical protein M407DRAFT_218794 [Tulasnella calospora MUT 4182]